MQTVNATEIENAQQQEEEVRRMTEHFMELWSAHRIEEHSRLLTEDADLVNVVGIHYRGRPDIQRLHEQLHSTIFSRSVSRIVEMNVHQVDVATVLVQAHWEMRGAAKLPGWNVPDPRTGVMTLLWVKQNGEWRVRAMHNTDAIPVPALPNS